MLEQLAQRLGWKLAVDEAAIRAAGRSLDERVSFTVENADEDQLLDALLTPAGLQAERNGNCAMCALRSDANHGDTRHDEQLHVRTRASDSLLFFPMPDGHQPFELFADRRLDLAFEHHRGERQIAVDDQFLVADGTLSGDLECQTS